MTLPAIYLKKREERRIRSGHPWIFSNEIDIQYSPLKGLTPGLQVQVRSHSDRLIGAAYVNPATLIAARIYDWDSEAELDAAMVARRMRSALALRERLFERPYYRLVYGETDGLPGLVADRYGDMVVCQFGTAGMERVRDVVVQAIDELVAPEVIVLRNDLDARPLEGLESVVEVVKGVAPEVWELEENGARFRFRPISGHKTGWYLDHRGNRAAMAAFVRDRHVLDVFSYVGAWGVQAAVAGASRVTCVDASHQALEDVAENARMNDVAGRVETREGDAFRVLKELAAQGEKYDVVVLDPPAFIKRKKDLDKGLEAYARINGLALQLLKDDGVLVSSSCSYRLARGQLKAISGRAARRQGRQLQILRQGGQGPDHPVHPQLPETEYLKTIIARVATL